MQSLHFAPLREPKSFPNDLFDKKGATQRRKEQRHAVYASNVYLCSLCTLRICGNQKDSLTICSTRKAPRKDARSKDMQCTHLMFTYAVFALCAFAGTKKLP